MEKHHKKTTIKHKHHKKQNIMTTQIKWLLAIAVLIILFNQYQLNSIYGMTSTSNPIFLGLGGTSTFSGNKDLANIDLSQLKSTGHTIAAVFPVEDIQTQEDALAIMFPTGTPEYGEQLGVSFDDPIESLSILAKMYRSLKAEVQQNNPEGWQRFMNLALKPVGISCEYCCGVGPIGIDKNGNSRCGCQHNPAVLTVALYLSAYTDYTDGEILREVMRWKTLFFPKNMIGLGLTVAGGDVSQLKLPGMVGGC